MSKHSADSEWFDYATQKPEALIEKNIDLLIERVLDRLRALRGPFECLILGGARGVDRIAGKWARDHGVLERDYLPEWHHAGGAEGEARNKLMIADAELVVAFPGGRGTADICPARVRSPEWSSGSSALRAQN